MAWDGLVEMLNTNEGKGGYGSRGIRPSNAAVWARMGELKEQIQDGRRFESMGGVSLIPPVAQLALEPQEELPL